jgi:Protein of unknown function (DUF551)
MSEWQPIESAPKDGSEILLAVGGGQRMVVGFYIGDLRPEFPWQGLDVVAFGRNAITHWMPLPEPPAQVGEARRGAP